MSRIVSRPGFQISTIDTWVETYGLLFVSRSCLYNSSATTVSCSWSFASQEPACLVERVFFCFCHLVPAVHYLAHFYRAHYPAGDGGAQAPSCPIAELKERAARTNAQLQRRNQHQPARLAYTSSSYLHKRKHGKLHISTSPAPIASMQSAT